MVEDIKMKKRSLLLLLLLQLRPKQWTKNFLVFAALLFSIELFSIDSLLRAVLGFFLFCFVSGAVYIVNDYMDREADRMHPMKCSRPIASGELSPTFAIIFGAILLIGSLFVASLFQTSFSLLLLGYFMINLAYSLKLKHVVIIDVMIIAAGFVMRAIGGALIIDVPFTPWFLLCVMLLALFLAVSKRRHEVFLLQNEKTAHRKVLDHYSVQFLDQMNSIVTTATVMSYALFTFTSGHTIHLMWTIPFVVYGIFRYLYLIHMEEKGGAPERVLLEDKPILMTVILYAIAVVSILAYFE